ncbi:MAG: hypothetical protein ACR2NR_07855 [Solirubrobacteraceae bacterium]
MPLRAMPQVGGQVSIEYLGATVTGVVSQVDVDGRRVEVTTDDGRLETFALNRATATFTADGSQTGARLRFSASDHP